MTEKQVERITNAAKNFSRELKAVAAELSDPDVARNFNALAETTVKTTAITVMIADVCEKLEAGRASDKENKSDETKAES